MSQKMGLIGRKLGMTRYFHDDGSSLGCTVLEVGPCVVTGQRTPEKHGYLALQLGFDEQPTRTIRRPQSGYFEKSGIAKIPAVVREVRLDEAKDVTERKIGDVITAGQIFKAGDVVDVVGVSKGKGYQGVMKRHKMGGDTMTHGTHEFFRHGGSIGCRLTPGRVHKGKRMSGRMGGQKLTSSDLVVVKVFEDKGLVLVKGSVPGPTNGIVMLKGSAKNVQKHIVPLLPKELEAKNPMKASKKAR
ncbi:MAG: 50S ribosomal protein L3 [Deltaproteobacteria bacterium]|jgi:large subunit ribosomal protein L3|nr:50S ribosomal protein L3 [Deltaproteobacteria bacterium]